MRPGIHLLLAAVLGGGLALSAAGQTRRIARFSHGGSVAALGAVKEVRDNMGIVQVFVAEEIERLTDSTASMRGYLTYRQGDRRNSTRQVQFATRSPNATPYGKGRLWDGHAGVMTESLKYLREHNPQATFIGFNHEQRKPTHQKPTSRTQTYQRRPFRYSCWRGLATVAALGAVGWLLGRKPKTV